MALPVEAEEDAAAFIVCLNDLVLSGSSLAQALAFLVGADGVFRDCLKEAIIECAAGLEPEDIKELIVACITGDDTPIDKAFLANVIQAP